jgi:hypothetical protein
MLRDAGGNQANPNIAQGPARFPGKIGLDSAPKGPQRTRLQDDVLDVRRKDSVRRARGWRFGLY